MVTSPKIIFIVVISLAFIVIAGMASVFWLIMQKTDPVLIGILTGPILTALGSLISLLNNTRTQAAPTPNPPADVNAPPSGGAPTPVTIENKPTDPVPVTQTP